jgi:AcrR family transcriptional regulator
VERVKKKRTRLSGSERREQIIRTATELFSRVGFRGATVRQLAERAGISEAMIYHHFPSKEALYDAMLQQKLENSKHLFYPVEAAEARQDRAVLETVIGNFLREGRKDTSYMRMMLYSALENHEFAAKVVHGPLQDFYRFLGSYLEQRMENGVMKTMSGQVAARLLMGMAYHATLLREIFHDPGLQDVDTEDLENTIVDLFCDGIRVASAENGSVPLLPARSPGD